MGRALVVKLVAGVMLVVGPVGLPSIAAGVDGEVTSVDLTIVRNPWGIDIAGCLPGVAPTLEGGNGLSASGHTTTKVNGSVVEESDDAVAWSLPGLEGDGTCPQSVYVTQRLSTEQLATAGVTLEDGRWTTFHLEMEIHVDRYSNAFIASRQFTIGAGKPIGAVTSTRSTADGTFVRGWVVHPSYGPMQDLTVTVDGAPWKPAETYPLEWYNSGRFMSGRPTSDPEWVDRGLGRWQDFELLVPPGRVCVYAPDTRDPAFPRTLLGCARSVTDGHPTVTITRIEQLAAPGSYGRPVRVSGYMTDPWAGPGERPDLMLTGTFGLWTVEATPAPDLRGPLSDGSGAFRFDGTIADVGPGNTRFCVAVSYRNEPVWWLNLHLPPPERRDLGCTVRYINAQLPTPPKGALDEMTASGGAVSARGWALDPNGGSPRVMLAIDGRPVAIDRTRLPRPDVRQAVGGDGNSGYQLTAGTTAGSHEVCVLWEDTTTGQWSSPMCRQMVVK